MPNPIIDMKAIQNINRIQLNTEIKHLIGLVYSFNYSFNVQL